MATDEEYASSEESSSFIDNLRRNLRIVTINEYVMFFLAGLAIFLMAGIIYVLAKAPQFFISNSTGTKFFYYVHSSTLNSQGLLDQYVFEMFIVAALLAIGAYGLYLIKNSTAYIDNQRVAFEVLAIGTVVFSTAAILLFLIYTYKMTGRFPYFNGLG